MVDLIIAHLKSRKDEIIEALNKKVNIPLISEAKEEQIFSLNALMNNLMTSYDMLVRNNEFERAQEVADQIDKNTARNYCTSIV